MGDPGRLSPDERDRFRQEKLRLVCSKGEGCLASFLKRDLLLERKRGKLVRVYVQNHSCLPRYQWAHPHLCARDSNMMADPIKKEDPIFI